MSALNRIATLRRSRRVAVPATALAVAGLLAVAGCTPGKAAPVSPASRAARANPGLDLGTSLNGVPAPGIRLVNQFGQPMTLGQFRGKVVILAFIDSRCTDVCPLTTESMVEAKNLLGAAGARVQLLAVDANPRATAVADIRKYSLTHQVINKWEFLTGSRAQLEATWRAYHIAAQINKGEINHTPAVFVIDTRGREQKLYLTQMAYASIGQAAQVLAQEAARLLPGHPHLRKLRSAAHVPGLGPGTRHTLPPATGSGSPVTLGPGKARMVVFFATWLRETSDLPGKLAALNSYAAAARRHGKPPLVAIDETTTEPSATAVGNYLRGLRQPPRYPVALDTTGRVADGYGVRDQPWFALVNASGRIVWHHAGWLPVTALLAAAATA